VETNSLLRTRLELGRSAVKLARAAVDVEPACTVVELVRAAAELVLAAVDPAALRHSRPATFHPRARATSSAVAGVPSSRSEWWTSMWRRWFVDWVAS